MTDEPDIALWRRALDYWWYTWGLSLCYWGIRTAEQSFFRAGVRSFDRAIHVWPGYPHIIETSRLVLAHLGQELLPLFGRAKSLGTAPAGEDRRWVRGIRPGEKLVAPEMVPIGVRVDGQELSAARQPLARDPKHRRRGLRVDQRIDEHNIALAHDDKGVHEVAAAHHKDAGIPALVVNQSNRIGLIVHSISLWLSEKIAL